MDDNRPFRRLPSCLHDGFGDFCLFPASTRFYASDGVASSWNSGEIMHIPVPDKNKRCFRYLELPKDIRDMIYAYLVEPFRDTNNEDLINIDLRPLEDIPKIRSPFLSKPHPFRNQYQISVRYISNSPISGSLRFSREPAQRTKQPAVVWVLSQVCHQIRQEIGDVFWSNVHIATWGYGNLLIDFLDDRPAIYAGIKRISTLWDCFESIDELDDKAIRFCETIGKRLTLDVLDLTLLTSVELARDLVASEGRIAWVHAFRKMGVKGLVFDLRLVGPDPLSQESTVDSDQAEDSDSSDDPYGPMHLKLQKELVPLIKAILIPPKSEYEDADLSEQHAYLQARAADIESSIAALDI